jgi:hypothetical protein
MLDGPTAAVETPGTAGSRFPAVSIKKGHVAAALSCFTGWWRSALVIAADGV